jgi:hypothetical protein
MHSRPLFELSGGGVFSRLFVYTKISALRPLICAILNDFNSSLFSYFF